VAARQFSYLSRRFRAGFHRSADASHVALDDGRDQAASNSDSLDNLHVGGFRHGIGRFDQPNQTARLYQSNRVLHRIVFLVRELFLVWACLYWSLSGPLVWVLSLDSRLPFLQLLLRNGWCKRESLFSVIRRWREVFRNSLGLPILQVTQI
jgi:hypothetical protein